MNSLNCLEVATLPGKGRGYKAITDIPAGSVIHVSEPLAVTVSQEWTPETCMWCFDFSYPKKQKVKALDEKESMELKEEWKLSSSKKKKNNKNNNTPLLKDMLFCSETCKQNCKSHGYQPDEWSRTLAVNHRIEEEFKASKSYDINVPVVTLSKQNTIYSKWISIDDDNALILWLEEAWNILTNDLELYKEIEDTDKVMCRLIAACISHKIGEEEGTVQPTFVSAAASLPQFKDLLVIQNNELSHFRSHFDKSLYPDHPRQLPLSIKKEEYLSILPSEVLEVMALYSFFSRSVTQPLSNVPTLSQVSHSLFRSIYFRERANSFGIWEMGDSEIAKGDGGVTDDLELLGWGIYPSAVYFNHSCDANVYKIRDGRSIKFIARRMIEKDEEACISYGSIGEDAGERRARLLEHYHFLCSCTRCNDEELKKKLIVR